MKIISVLLTLILTIAWAYTSWYWYTCNVKGLCEMTFTQSQNVSETNSTISELDEEDISEITQSGTTQDTAVQNLSSSDVLTGAPARPTPITTSEAEVESDENLIKETSQETPTAATGTGEIENTSNATDTLSGICDGSFIGPVAYGGNNSEAQVRYLQAFLINQGLALTVTGTYSAADFQAVKDFQLKYREDILDPWDITEPTGYVYTTTVKKMKELACQ